MFLLKLLFPKLWFGLDDLNPGGGDPSGQPDPEPGNDPAPTGDPAAPSPTDFVEFEGVRIPAEAFEKTARERYPDAFDAQQNRDKWSAENTRKAQENKQLERDAEAYRAMKSQPQNQTQPKNEYEAMREQYIREKSEFYPDADPQKLQSFLGKEFDWNAKLAGFKANESLIPIRQQQALEYEHKFLAAHPDIQIGSKEYHEIANLMRDEGLSAEHAYEKVAGWANPERRKSLIQKEVEAAIKAKDDERLKKLKATPVNSQDGDKPMTGTRSERIWRALEKAGVQRE